MPARVSIRRSPVVSGLALLLAGALAPALGGCACRCTGAVRSESSRSLAFLMNAESARQCAAVSKTVAAPSTFARAVARDTKAGLASFCRTAEVYGGCAVGPARAEAAAE